MNKNIFWILLLGICLGFGFWSLGFWVGGCGHQVQQTPAEIAGGSPFSPADGATGVDFYPAISAVFKQDMNPLTITTSTFNLVSSAGAVSGTVSYNAANKTAYFTPAGNLSFWTKYTATLSDQVKDTDGNKLNSPYSWSFTVGGYTEALGVTDETFSDGTHVGYVTYNNVILGIQQDSYGNSMVMDARGRILVAGQSRYKDPNSTNVIDCMAVWRINPDGSLDKSFGDQGVAHSNYGETIGRSLILDQNGKILVAGEIYSTTEGLTVWRFNPDGSADGSFGTGGKTGYPLAWRGFSIALDSAGNIFVAGEILNGSILGPEVIAQFQPDGTFDKTFDIAATPEGVAFRTENTTTDVLGKTLLVGASISRYNPDQTLDQSFGQNGTVSIYSGDASVPAGGASILIDAFGRVVVMGGIGSPGRITGSAKMAVWRFK